MFTTLYEVLCVSGSVVAGLVLGFVFVGTFVYKTNKYDDACDSASESESSEDEDNELHQFQDSGFDTLSEMKSYPIIKEKFEHLKTSFIDIETPEGLCKMNYDDSVESFTYYCDNKSISYKTLDAVARQYAIKYNCKAICVNYKEEYEKAKKRLQTKQEQQEQEQAKQQEQEQSTVVENKLSSDVVEDKSKKVEEPRSPFAKLKNYKTVEQPSLPKAKTTNIKTDVENENDKEDQDVLVITKANKFRFIGLIKDFVQPNAKPDSYKNINYSSFKHLMENKSTTM